MVFTSASWVLKPTIDYPDSITVGDFLHNDAYNRRPIAESHNPYTCGISGRTFTAQQVADRVQYIARSLGKACGWSPDDELTAWDKVGCIYSQNAIDYITVAHSIHRLNGIVTPASASYSAPELEVQLRSSEAKMIVTCTALLASALKAAEAVGIPRDRVFIMEMAGSEDAEKKCGFRTVGQLADEGKSLPELPKLRWTKGQGHRQIAFLNYSSGTSGLPKAVKISHFNIISNIMNQTSFDAYGYKARGVGRQMIMGLLPFSHIYGLVIITHCGAYRGDGVVVLPGFKMNTFLGAISRFRVELLNVVPPIIIQMLRSREECDKADLSSVRSIFTGAAPLGPETIAELESRYPNWLVGQGYGMTETSTGVCQSSEHDIMPGSSGCLLPGTRTKLMSLDGHGKEITAYDTPGELWVQSPSVAVGYLHNERATAETFVHDHDGRWIKTGDEVLVRKSPLGNEHFFIVDRIKELIKVKGHQVAPAELEAHLLAHNLVEDCAVIQVPDERAGEVPKAYVVRSTAARSMPDEDVVRSVQKHVEDHKARYKWLKGGVEFIDAIPKNPSGKILRRMLRDKEKAARRDAGAKL